MTVWARMTVGAPAMVERLTVRGVDLAWVVAPAAQPSQVVVGKVLDQPAEPFVRPEEVSTDVPAGLDAILLELSVEGGVHLGDEDAVDVGSEELVPFPAPDDLDHVPARAAEQAFEFLDDLAVAAHRAVEALQVAVDDVDQVVESFPSGQCDTGEALGFVHLTVAGEAPHRRPAGVDDAAIGEVAVEAGLVGGIDQAEAHRNGGELPEVRSAWMRVAGQPTTDLAAEPVEVGLPESALEERPGVDPGGSVSLNEHLITVGAVGLTPEEVVEPDLVEGGGRRVGGQVAADAVKAAVGPGHHDGRVPADEVADASLEVFVAWVGGFVGGRDRVDVVGHARRRKVDPELVGSAQHVQQQATGPPGAVGVDQPIEGLDPLVNLAEIGIGELAKEAVRVHRVAHRLAPASRVRTSCRTSAPECSTSRVAVSSVTGCSWASSTRRSTAADAGGWRSSARYRRANSSKRSTRCPYQRRRSRLGAASRSHSSRAAWVFVTPRGHKRSTSTR